MKYVRISLILIAILSSLSLQAHAKNQLRLCQDEITETPWRTLSNDGLNTLLLKELGKRLDLTISIENLSWKRCLLMVQQGLFDGAVAASFLPERMQIGVYPADSSGQTPDHTRRLSGEKYYLYKSMQDPLTWDGNTFSHNTLPIAAPMGYSTVTRLQDKGARVDDRDRKPEQLLRKVATGLASAAVLAQGVGDKWLKTPEFLHKITRLPTPFYQTAGYLLLSRPYVNENSILAEHIWDAIKSIRASPAYRAELLRHGLSAED